MIILFFFKGQVKSPILHNTRNGSEFYVPFRTICNLEEGLGLWVGWEEGEEESQGSMPAYYEACLKT